MSDKIVPYRSAHDVEKILACRFASPEYAFLAQVRNQTGFSKRVRTADALAMSLYPSRGLHLYGFEIKISRSDWLSEMRNPSKAEDFYQFCHHWYLVVSDPKIVGPGELPSTWGLIDVSTGKCKTITEAPYNKDVQSPDIRFLAGVLRKASEIQAVNDFAEINKAREEARKEERKLAEIQLKNRLDQASDLRATVDDFEKRSGVRIQTWQRGDIAEAVRMVVNGISVRSRLEGLRNSAQSILTELNSALDAKEVEAKS